MSLFSCLKSSWVGRWFFEVFRAVDNGLNALFGGFARETISSRLGRTYPNCILCKLLNYVEPDHCRKASIREKPIVDWLINKYGPRP